MLGKDGVGHKVGDYSTDAAMKELEQILEIMESASPLSHIKKTFL